MMMMMSHLLPRQRMLGHTHTHWEMYVMYVLQGVLWGGQAKSYGDTEKSR